MLLNTDIEELIGEAELLLDEVEGFIGNYNPDQPRDAAGKWVDAVGKMGYRNPFDPREIVIDDIGTVSIRSWEGKGLLQTIRTFERGKGHGTKILKKLISKADELGVTLTGFPKPFGQGGLKKAQLVKWYKRHGFTVKGEDIFREPLTDNFDPDQPRIPAGQPGGGQFLGVGGSGSPSDSTTKAPTIRQFFQMMIKARGDNKPKGWKYGCIEELLEKEGIEFKGSPRPPGVWHGPMKLCYENAWRLADNVPDAYTYVEGMATTATIPGLPLNHAWVVDNRTGQVVDPTWKDGREYIGIPLDREFVRKTLLEKGTYGVIDNMEQGFPLLKNGIKAANKVRIKGLTDNFDPDQPRDEQGQWTDEGGVFTGGAFGVDFRSKKGRDVKIPSDRQSRTAGIFRSEVQSMRSVVGGELSSIPDVKNVMVYDAPVLSSKMTGLPVEQDFMGLYDSGKQTMHLGVATADEPDLIVGADRIEGGNSIIRHEYGHFVYDEMPGRVRGQYWAARNESDMTQVSRQASMNEREGFAEIWTAWSHPDYKMGMLPKPVEAYLVKYFPRQSVNV